MYIIRSLAFAAILFYPFQSTSAAPAYIGRDRIQRRQTELPASTTSSTLHSPSPTPSPVKNIPGIDRFDPANPFAPIRRPGSDYPTFDPQVVDWFRNGQKGRPGFNRIKARRENSPSGIGESSASLSAFLLPSTTSSLSASSSSRPSASSVSQRIKTGPDESDPRNPLVPFRSESEDDRPDTIRDDAVSRLRDQRKNIMKESSQRQSPKSHEKFKGSTVKQDTFGSEDPTSTSNDDPSEFPVHSLKPSPSPTSSPSPSSSPSLKYGPSPRNPGLT